jgi:hypothetical protein
MTNVANDALSSNSKPEFDTVRKAIESFGLKLVAEPIEEKKSSISCPGRGAASLDGAPQSRDPTAS